MQRLIGQEKSIFSFVFIRVNNAPFVSLSDPDVNADIFKGLVSDGLLLVEKRREKRLAKLVSKMILSFSIFSTEFHFPTLSCHRIETRVAGKSDSKCSASAF